MYSKYNVEISIFNFCMLLEHNPINLCCNPDGIKICPKGMNKEIRKWPLQQRSSSNHSQMEGKNNVPDHKIRTRHSSKVKTDSCRLTCTGYHKVTSLHHNFHDSTSAIFVDTTTEIMSCIQACQQQKRSRYLMD